MKRSPTTIQSRILQKTFALGGLAALTAALPALAQQTVFYDTFGSSTLNVPNSLPGGTPTASSTSYTVASAKNATATVIAPGHLHLTTAATSSGNSEIQAVFTKYPVTLASVGDYVELDETFTDSTNILGGNGGNSSALFAGIFNSGGVPPLGGTVLWNGGLSTGLTTADTGGTASWVGFNTSMYNQQTANTSPWYVGTRPVQTAVNNGNQGLLYNYPQGGSSHGQSASAFPFPFPNLTLGSQYTVQLRVTLSAAGALTVSNGLYAGVGTGGTFIFGNVGTFTGTAAVTTNFDSLGIGYRASDSLSTHVPWTNDINSITVIAGLAAQAGPYFNLTSSGNGCGGATIGLSGSVTTNVYMLFTNGVFNGNSLPGTGSALNFGTQYAPAIYTIEASNTVTASVGPMNGSQTVSETAPVITLQPVPVSCVTNAPATFSVAATGNTLSYQWYRNAIALTNGAEISGAQTPNLVISAAQAQDAATTAHGYYAVVQDPCGDSVTSAPNVSLILQAPNNLVWQGGNPDNTWDLATTLNFTNQTGAFEAFTNGDNVTFNDSSAYPSVTLSTNMAPSLVTVNGTQSYSIAGPGSLVGFGKLIDNNSGGLTLTSSNTFTGGTVISNGATLNLGDGSSGIGSVSGTVNISTNAVLDYNYLQNANIYNTLAGNGTVNYQSSDGGTLTIPTTAISSNFTGTLNLVGIVRVHASDGNLGYELGNGSTVNVPSSCQIWCDRSSTTYNNIFNIAGTGWPGTSGGGGSAALSVYGCTLNGAINLQADARIGGTINGATILAPITGNYQLEVWGTAGSYVLSLNPTNGINNYAATLITSGSILTLNTNALSTGPLTMDLAGDLRLDGNNLTVSNLTSTDSGSVAGNGPTIENTSATTAATLTVGTDGTSSEYDGTFFNGGTAALGLTKIGAGILTLTGVNTNTGAVIVKGGSLLLNEPGSFANAALISAASGATFDVSGRGDQTLTLNSGQTLTGSGTVNGNVASLAGSTIIPGDTIGTLTVTGNATLAGTLVLELNRTNSPAINDSLAVTGTFTPGGTLAVTNVGPALHVGDAFQLFAAGTSGFSLVSLQTTDVVNNVVYTWHNNLAASGSVSLASVTSLINTNPPKLQVSVTGNTLNLGWPTNAGWTLLTNSVGLTATSQWYPYPNSASLTNVSLQINPAKTNVFFRMVYPYP